MLGQATLRRAALFASLVVLITAAVLVGLRWVPFVVVIERWLDDIRISVLTPSRGFNEDIVILALTEDTLAKFPYRSPVDRDFLATVLGHLSTAGVRAVAIDILFDQQTEPEKDRTFKAALESFPAPVVVSWGDTRAGMTKAQLAFMDDYLANTRKGFANLIKDRDGIVRNIFHGDMVGDSYRHGLALELTVALGLPIPDESGLIAYSALTEDAKSAFKSFPSHAVGVLPKAWFADKIVLIGADLPQQDRHLTPFSSAFGAGRGALAGIEIHAHVLAQVLDGRKLPRIGWPTTAAMVAVLVAIGLVISVGGVPMIAQITAGTATIAALWGGAGLLFANHGMMIPLFAPTLGFLATGGIGTFYVARRQREEKRFIREAFSRYLSPSVVADLANDPGRLTLGGQRQELTFIFTDIAGFTTVSETTEPSVLVPALNAYLDGICQIVIEHQGTIDKFIGDAVVSFFNAPVAQPDHARRAVACALAMSAFTAKFAAEKNAEGIAFGLTRIGVHTGPATVGNFGGDIRFDYTAIGDTVNTAARLESVNKHLGTTVCVSGKTIEQCPDVACRPVGELVLKGKTEGVAVFEPLSADQAESAATKQYRAAYRALEEADGGDGARAAFADLARDHPEDPLACLHLKRLKDGKTGTRIVMDEK